jgi:hypothetical protein
MTFTVLYRDTGSVIGNYEERADAVRDAVSIALERPDLSLFVGFAEVGDDGMPITCFISASDLLADHGTLPKARSWSNPNAQVRPTS